MLIGQYEGKVDVKGRTAFPKKFREILGDKLIVTQGYENSLIVVSEENWKALLEGTEGKPFIQSETRETQRFLLEEQVMCSSTLREGLYYLIILENLEKLKQKSFS